MFIFILLVRKASSYQMLRVFWKFWGGGRLQIFCQKAENTILYSVNIGCPILYAYVDLNIIVIAKCL